MGIGHDRPTGAVRAEAVAPIAAPRPSAIRGPGEFVQSWRIPSDMAAVSCAISSHDARGTRPGATKDRGGGDPCDSEYRNSPGRPSVLPNRRPPGPGRNQAPARGASHYTDSHDANHGRPSVRCGPVSPNDRANLHWKHVVRGRAVMFGGGFEDRWYEVPGVPGLELSGDLRFRGRRGLRKLRHDGDGRPYVLARKVVGPNSTGAGTRRQGHAASSGDGRGLGPTARPLRTRLSSRRRPAEQPVGQSLPG